MLSTRFALPKACIAALILTCALPGPAWADGMVTYHSEVGDAQTMAVQATAQRAVLWYRDGTWQIIIQPKFDRLAGSAAWIVPFTVVPTVTQADSELFEALETLTAPIFAPYCFEEEDSSGWFGCSGVDYSGEGGLSNTAPAETMVTVWNTGTTDQLEYVVLEGTGGQALIDWLETEGYRVPAPLAQNPDMLKDRYLFAAKLLPGLNPEKPLSPLNFALPGIGFDKIAYPMRLTALVAPEEGMELVLWVVAPVDQASLAPDSLDWLPYSGARDVTKAQWEENRARIRQAFPPKGGMVLEYSDHGAGGLQTSPYFGYGLPVPDGHIESGLEAMGVDRDKPWPADVVEMADGNYAVSRFVGKLTSQAMEQDLSFGPTAMTLDSISNFYFRKVPCSEITDDPTDQTVAAHGNQNRALGGMALLAALMISLFVLARGRRIR